MNYIWITSNYTEMNEIMKKRTYGGLAKLHSAPFGI